MSEIEKMYENAGIELGRCKYAEYGYEGEEGTWYYCIKENKECWTYPNGDTNCVEKDYPPFTAEKQLGLIKILAKGEVKINNEDGEYEFSLFDTVSDFSSFAESLADLTNRMWQDLTEEEKQQIKEILK